MSNTKPIEVNRKPAKCPTCGGKVVIINYGEPTYEAYQAEQLGICLPHRRQLLLLRLLIAIFPARRTPPVMTFFTVSSALQ